MAITITEQPTSGTLVAAYRPIKFVLIADQQPLNVGACPVIMADVYLNGLYYASFSVTDYEIVVAFFTYYYYTFDIQDKLQEYLDLYFARMYEQTKGDMENQIDETFSARVQVKFREGYIDANGFTKFYGTAPVMGTKYTAPVAGTGTVTSNIFYCIAASLKHLDNMDLPTHLTYYKEAFQATYQLSHRPNNNAGLTVGGGKYYISRQDNDFVFCFSNGYSATTWLVGVAGTYRNGTTFTSAFKPYTLTVSPQINKVYSINGGIAALMQYIPYIDWANVIEYEVFVFDFFFQAMRQKYYIIDCCERVRLFFRNKLGTWDGISFEYAEETTTTESTKYQKSLPLTLTTKAARGTSRMQPTQGEVVTVQCKEYGEKDQDWIKELLDTPVAYVQWAGGQGQGYGLLPVNILDSEIKTLKNGDRYEYLLILKYEISNRTPSLRI